MTVAAADFAGGDGTSVYPYLIKTAEHLDNVRHYPSAYFRMIDDIVFTPEDFEKGGAFYNDGKGWIPIGDDSTKFKGNFNGSGNTITGLYIAAADKYAGLFGNLYNARVTNLGMIDTHIDVRFSNKTGYAGSIAGYAFLGKITDCYNTGTVTTDVCSTTNASYYSYTGGIVGYGNTDVLRCYNTGTVTSERSYDHNSSAPSYVGGIAGDVYTVTHCYNTGKVVETSSYAVGSTTKAGGITGRLSNELRNCFNAGEILVESIGVSGKDVQIGGIAGYVDAESLLENCYNVGEITVVNTKDVVCSGGIAGYASDASVSGCYYLNNIGQGVGSGDDTCVSCTKPQLKQEETFESFNFSSDWTMKGNESYFFPELKAVNMAYDGLFAGGSGTRQDPYLIETAAHLDAVRSEPYACFVLMEDIVFDEEDFEKGGAFYNDGSGWLPLGTESALFTGDFDGNGHTITGLTATGEQSSLFGDTQDAAIYDLGLVDVNITADGATGGSGGIAGKCTDTTIARCYTSGAVEITGRTAGCELLVGGIAAQCTGGSVENCYTTAAVTLSAYGENITACIGGIVGQSDGAAVTACYSTGTVTTNGSAEELATGGIVGSGDGAEDCYFLSTQPDDGGCTAEALYSADTFVGFDFDEVWTMEGNEDYRYPELQTTGMVYTKRVTGISITTLPYVTVFFDDETPDFDGLVVTADYDNDTSAEIDDYTLTYDRSLTGSVPVAVSYAGKTAQFFLTITEKAYSGGHGTEDSPYLIENALQLAALMDHPDACFLLIEDISFSEEDFAQGGDFYNNGSGWTPLGTAEAPFTGSLDCDGHIISGLYIHLEHTGTDAVYAGLFGYIDGGSITGLGMVDTHISLSASEASAYAGSIAGVISNGSLHHCYHNGTVVLKNNDYRYRCYAGGLTGCAGSGTISSCYNAGSVTINNPSLSLGAARNYVGGIAGYTSSAITDCYNTGKMNAACSNTTFIGGITGNNWAAITRCYNIGTVSASEYGRANYVGSIVGYCDDPYENCFYLEGSAAHNGVGYARTAAQMTQADTFLGFDFNKVWTLAGNTDYPYPELRGLPMDYSKMLVSISVTELPHKMHYDAGEPLDARGLEVSGLYDNGLSQPVDHYQLDYDFSQPGEAIVTVSCEGKTAQFTVCVNDGLFSGGLGSENFPYLIATAADLDAVRDQLTANYRMVSDILFTGADFSSRGDYYNGGAGWQPIGSQITPFTGTFDGDGHTITGLYTNLSTGTSSVYAGLFGRVEGAAICNLALRNADISVDTDLNAYIGGIVASAENVEIEGCSVSGILLARSTQSASAGGIAGYVYAGTISRCGNTAAVISESNHPKGLSDYDAYAGGILGRGMGRVDVSVCYNVGSVTAESPKNDANAGGILGESCTTIINCFNAGTVTAKAYDNGYKSFPNWAFAAGIASAGADTMTCCYNIGEVRVDISSSTSPVVRGIASYATFRDQVTNCYYVDSLMHGIDDPTQDLTVRCNRWQMTQQSTFTGFDFTNVWTMGDGDYPYPLLRGVDLEVLDLSAAKTASGIRVALSLPGTTTAQVHLLAAAYDEDSQLVTVQMYTGSVLDRLLAGGGTITLPDFHHCKCFLTDLDYQPLLEAVTAD